MARGTAGYIGRGVDGAFGKGIWTIQEVYERALDSRWPPLFIDFLVVAGGGAGGNEPSPFVQVNGGSGGGAGGVLTGTLSVPLAVTFFVSIGAGGSPSAVASLRGGSGVNSFFGTISAIGGGGGGGAYQGEGATNGGSGGGANTQATSGVATAGLGASGQGNNGGSVSPAGGGGAGSVGGNSGGGVSGLGGSGFLSLISGTSVFYGGGGGGGGYRQIGGAITNLPGSGGTGGGGTGANGGFADGTAGSSNTGGGGGGGGNTGNSSSFNGKAGGSGIVILKYPNGATISNPGGGLTFTTATDGTYKVTTFTAGTGNVSFALT